MAGWIDVLLIEWRERFAGLAPRDHASSAEEAGSPPTHALDLLRAHVARSGVQLILSDPAERRQVPDRRIERVKPVVTENAVPERGADAGTRAARFGRRDHPVSADGAAERLALLPQDALRSPAETRRAAQAFRASAYSEVEALRADVARLSETLAGVMVENRTLKRTLDARRGG